jgi:hypothetical protein
LKAFALSTPDAERASRVAENRSAKPHICSRFIVYTKQPAGSARGFVKKVDEGGSVGGSSEFRKSPELHLGAVGRILVIRPG